MTDDQLNAMWYYAVGSGDPTAGNAHLRFARAVLAAQPAPAVPDDVLRALLKHNEELFAAYRARTAVPAVPAVPAVREPLTDAAITQLMPSGEYMMTPGELRDFARAIERAHGITGDSK